MTTKHFLKTATKEIIRGPKEMKFDLRLMEKRVEQGFLSQKEADSYIKDLPQETDYDFSSHEKISAEDTSGDTPSEKTSEKTSDTPSEKTATEASQPTTPPKEN